jgi:8-oxo-dGTP pyrophosphatase MutT (NUDIX family)
VIEYVEGLLFSECRGVVVLVRKSKDCKIPRLRGKLCGLGGKIEPGEHPARAMAREFFEESGVLVPISDWENYAVLEGPDFRVHFFVAFNDSAWPKVKTIENKGEEVGFYPVKSLDRSKLTPNLPVFLNLAIDDSGLMKPIELRDMMSQDAA